MSTSEEKGPGDVSVWGSDFSKMFPDKCPEDLRRSLRDTIKRLGLDDLESISKFSDSTRKHIAKCAAADNQDRQVTAEVALAVVQERAQGLVQVA